MSNDFTNLLSAQEKMTRAKHRLEALTGPNRVEDARDVEAISCRINGTILDREILDETQGAHAAEVYYGFVFAAKESGITRDRREQILVQAHHALTCVASLDFADTKNFDWNTAFDDTLRVAAPYRQRTIKPLPSDVECALLGIFADQIENGRMTLNAHEAEDVAELPQSWGFNLFDVTDTSPRTDAYERFHQVRSLVDRLAPRAASAA